MAAKTGLPAALTLRINRTIDSYAGAVDHAVANAHSADDYLPVSGIDGRKYNVRVRPNPRPHNKTKPPAIVVEFYWPDKHVDADPFKHYAGYSYNLSTLVKALGARDGGLTLDSSTRESIDRETLTHICVWAVGGDPYSTYG